MKANNQYQQVLWYLINFKQFSLSDVIKDSMFFKMQTRLSDLEREHGILAKRIKQSFTNRFGRKSQYNIYEAIDIEKCKSIYNKMTRL